MLCMWSRALLTRLAATHPAAISICVEHVCQLSQASISSALSHFSVGILYSKAVQIMHLTYLHPQKPENDGHADENCKWQPRTWGELAPGSLVFLGAGATAHADMLLLSCSPGGCFFDVADISGAHYLTVRALVACTCGAC